MTVTSAPIGSTGQSLDGFAVNANVPDAFRESVVLTDPNDPLGAAAIVSTQPIAAYGLPVWLLGTPSVAIAGVLPPLTGVSSTFVVNPASASSTFIVNIPNPSSTVVVSSAPHALVGTSQVFGQVSTFPTGVSSTFAVNAANPVSTFAVNNPGTVSTQIVSSLPIFVAQSSAPWDVRGGVGVTSFPAIASTVVVSSVPHALVGTSQVFGTVSTQVVSSIPMLVAQSSAPWTVNGGVQVTNVPTVNVTNVPQVNITTSIPFFVAQSSAPWTINGGINVSSQVVASSWPLSTTLVNVVSSIPIIVSQSSAVWQTVETVSTAGGTNASSYSLLANLNTTVVKAAAGQVYGIIGTNVGSSNVFVRIYNLSTAALTIASTAVPKLIFGIPASSAPIVMFDVGVNFPNGISFITQQQPFTATNSIAITASTAAITVLFA